MNMSTIYPTCLHIPCTQNAQRWQAGVDLETKGGTMITVPIHLAGGYGLEGRYSNGVVAVLQMVLGQSRLVTARIA